MNYYELSQEIYYAIKKGLPVVQIFHYGNNDVLKGTRDFHLPSPQVSGTYTQQDTYARMRASSLTDEIKDYVNSSEYEVSVYKIYQ